MCAGNRCDLQVLLQGRTRHMQATVLQERAFGFLEAGESVLWASVPVLQEALDAVSVSILKTPDIPAHRALVVPECLSLPK